MARGVHDVATHRLEERSQLGRAVHDEAVRERQEGAGVFVAFDQEERLNEGVAACPVRQHQNLCRTREASVEGVDWGHAVARPTKSAVGRVVLEQPITNGMLDVRELWFVELVGASCALLLSHSQFHSGAQVEGIHSLILPEHVLSPASSFPGAPRINDGGCWMASQVPTAIALEPL